MKKSKKPKPASGDSHGRAARLPIFRIMQIHDLLKEGKFPNCQDMAQELEVSYKTVQRDIDFMRDMLKLPIAYHPVEHGFHYTKNVDKLPTMALQEGEIVSLLVAQKAVEQYRGTPFEASLRGAFSKLAHSMPTLSEVSLHELGAAVSFRPAGPPLADLENFQKISSAVIASREISFLYRKPGDGSGSQRQIRPYHLGCIGGLWYLIGYDLEREAVRTFAITRIASPRTLKKSFKRPKDFSLESLLGESFSAFESSDPKLVRIRLDPIAAALASERQWHPSQKTTHHKDGSAELTLKVGLAPDLEAWIMGLGFHAEVMAPAELRKNVAAKLRKASSLYR